jgi:hypothetical protein
MSSGYLFLLLLFMAVLCIASLLLIIFTVINCFKRKKKILMFNFVMLILNVILWAPACRFAPESMFVPFSILLILAIVNVHTSKRINKGGLN